MKLEIPKMDRLVKDKNVLYVIFFLAVCNVLGYLTVSNFDAVVLFLVVGFLTTYFSKNMIIVLLVSMITTNLFVASKKGRKEGMENKEDAKEDDKEVAVEDQKEKNQKQVKEKEEEPVKSSIASASSNKVAKDTQVDHDAADADEGVKSSSAPSGKKRLDMSDTLEKAYAKLQEHVGEEGVEGLTKKSGALLTQQKDLMDNINTIKPFLEKAEVFMDKMDFAKIDGLTSMLQNFIGN